MTSVRSAGLRSCLLAGLFAVAGGPVFAAATTEEAARLQGVFERYVGHPTDGTPGWATVVPEADHYRATLDIAKWVRPLVARLPEDKRTGLALDLPPLSVALEPRDDGTWRIWDYRLPKISIGVDGQVTDLVAEGIEIESITDPVTGVTPSMKGRIARTLTTSTIRQSDGGLRYSTAHGSTGIVLEGEAEPGTAPDTLDVAVRQTTAAMDYTMEFVDGAAAGIPDMKFVLKAGPNDTTATVRGMRWQPLLDLWAHLVAHHDEAASVVGQSTVKAKLAAVAPLFDTYTQKVSAGGFEFESPFAVAKGGKVGIDIDLAGLVREGRFGAALGVTDFEAHSLFMPKWVRALVPTDLALAVRVSGYDLATPFSVFLDEADFTAAKPLSPETDAKIGALFLPSGAAEIVLDGNRIVGKLYDLAVDGRLTAGRHGSKGAITVRAHGLDAVAEHLAGPDADDPQARQFAGGIALARTFAERKGDEFVWRIDIDGEHVAVNGKPVK